MVDKIKKYIDNKQMIKKGDTIILGISGGADSVCLFFVLLELKVQYELQLIAVHVNHNLRGEDADRDQQYVEELCQAHGVECVVVSVDVAAEAVKRKRSLEEAGREVRQEAFAKVAKEWAIREAREQDLGKAFHNEQVKIATAHHSNDNAETLLMNLVRGTGLGGLTGIAPVRGNYIRPLLGVKRSDIEAYLEENKKKYCIDMTNHENIYIRNVIRNQVIPILEACVNSQTVAHMESTMEELTRIEAYLQEQVDECWSICIKEEGSCGVVVDYEGFRGFPQILQEKTMKKALEYVAGHQRDLTRTHVNQLLGLFEKQVGREIHLPYGVVGARVYEGIRIYEKDEAEKIKQQDGEKSFAEKSITMTILDGDSFRKMKEVAGEELLDTPYTKYFDYDIMEKIPSVRVREVGDYIIINSRGNKQTLKKYYTTNKVPSHLRESIPVVAIDKEILWVVGYRKSSGYETNDKTRKILEVRCNGGYDDRNS